MLNRGTVEQLPMRRGISGSVLLAAVGFALAGCGAEWQPSWNTSSRPIVPGDSLTMRRVTGQDPEFEPLRSEDPAQLRLSAGALRTAPAPTPEAAVQSVPEYRPVPRPDIERRIAPEAAPRTGSATPSLPANRPPRAGSSTPPPVASVPPRATIPARPAAAAPATDPPERRDDRVIAIPGQPPAVTTDSAGRVQSVVQPGNPAGGIAIRDGGTTTVIQPGGRVTTVPTTR
jgi:hypothetical protein